MKKLTYSLGAALLIGTVPAMAGTWWMPSKSAMAADPALQEIDVTWTRPSDSKTFTNKRAYTLYLPAGVTSGASLPLVIVLHGGGMSYSQAYDASDNIPSSYWVAAPSFCDPNYVPSSPYTASQIQAIAKNCRGTTDSSGKFTPQSLADYYHIVVAFPNGIDDQAADGGWNSAAIETKGHSWNDCSGFFPGFNISLPWNVPNASSVDYVLLQNPGWVPPGTTGTAQPVNDVAFINQMIDEIENTVNAHGPSVSMLNGATINDKQVYVTGISNGSNMAMRLSRELSGRIAAAAIEAGGEGARPSNVANWVATKPNFTPTYVLPMTNGKLGAAQVLYMPLTQSDTIAAGNGNAQACTATQSELPAATDPNSASHVPGYVPLFLVKGNADIFVAYRGGTSNSSSSAWYLPYNTDGGTAQGPDLNAFPSYPLAPVSWPKLGSQYVDPWQFTWSYSYPTYYPTTCTTSVAGVQTCPENSALTSPAALSTMGNILNRYGLASTVPVAYTVKTYVNFTETNSNNYYPGGAVQTDIVSSVGGSGSCDKYGSGRKTIVSCIATNNGHIQPSGLFEFADGGSGMQQVGIQSHDMETALEEWLFFKGYSHP